MYSSGCEAPVRKVKLDVADSSMNICVADSVVAGGHYILVLFSLEVVEGLCPALTRPRDFLESEKEDGLRIFRVAH